MPRICERKQSLSLRLWAYVGKEFLFSLIVAFLFFFFLFFVNQILVIVRDVLSKHVDPFRTMMLIVFALPAIIALAMPFASLVGCIMAVGRFSSDNEIAAFQACGTSLLQIFLPILIIAILLGAFSFLVNDILLPLGTVNYVRLYQELIYSNSELILEPYSINRFNDSTLASTQVSKGQFGDLLLIDVDDEGRKRIINAKSGSLVPDKNQYGVVSLALKDVEVLQISRKGEDFDSFTARETQYNMLIKSLSDSLHDPGPREMSSLDLSDSINEMENTALEKLEARNFKAFRAMTDFARSFRGTDFSALSAHEAQIWRLEKGQLPPRANDRGLHIKKDRMLQLYLLEFWKKFSLPSGAFLLVFLGFPAGIFARRSGRSIGFGIGFIIAVIFWSLITAGQALGTDNTDLSPFWLMWAPNILFLGLGIFLFVRRVMR